MAQIPPTPLLPTRFGEESMLLSTRPIFDDVTLGEESWISSTPKAAESTLRVSDWICASSTVTLGEAAPIAETTSKRETASTHSNAIVEGRANLAHLLRERARSSSSTASQRSLREEQSTPARDDFFTRKQRDARRSSLTSSRPSSPQQSFLPEPSPPSLASRRFSPLPTATGGNISSDGEIAQVHLAWRERPGYSADARGREGQENASPHPRSAKASGVSLLPRPARATGLSRFLAKNNALQPSSAQNVPVPAFQTATTKANAVPGPSRIPVPKNNAVTVVHQQIDTDERRLESPKLPASGRLGPPRSPGPNKKGDVVSGIGASPIPLPTLTELSDCDSSMTCGEAGPSTKSQRLASFFTNFLSSSLRGKSDSTPPSDPSNQEPAELDLPDESIELGRYCVAMPDHFEAFDKFHLHEMADVIDDEPRLEVDNMIPGRSLHLDMPSPSVADLQSGQAAAISTRPVKPVPKRKDPPGFTSLTKPLNVIRPLQPSRNKDAPGGIETTDDQKETKPARKPPTPHVVTRRPATSSAFASAALARLPPPGTSLSSASKPIRIRTPERARDLAKRRKVFEGPSASSSAAVPKRVGGVARTVPVSGRTPGKASRARAAQREAFDAAVNKKMAEKERERRELDKERAEQEEEEYQRRRKETVIWAKPVPDIYKRPAAAEDR